MKFAQILDKLMNERDISAYKISKETGISDRLIGYWRKGEKLPGAENLLIIADYFEVTVDYLLKGEKTSDSSTEEKQQQSFVHGNTYNGTANIAIGNDIKQTNFNMADKQLLRSSDTDKIVQELDEMMHSLDNDAQRELLAAQVRNNIETFKKLLGTSKKNRINKTNNRSKYKYKQYCTWEQ